MLYDEFVEDILRAVRESVDGKTEVSVHSAVKNNGCRRKGIAFSERGNRISPTIYLEEYYDKYRQGQSISKITDQVMAMYHNIRLKSSWEGMSMLNYQEVKDRIIYKLLNHERNEELLKKIPHKDYLDLAVVFCVLVEMDESGERMATMMIGRDQLRWWKVDAEELYKRAAANTEKLLPCEFSSLCLVAWEMMGYRDVDEEEWKSMREEESMYILTNELRNYGAAAMLYPGRLEMIGAYFKENYYILPSSIHELIVLPESKALPKQEMDCMVREVNVTHVLAEEVLSAHAYYYDREKKEIRL